MAIPGVNAVGAISPRTGEVYLSTFPISGLLKVVNGRTNKVTATITVDAPPPGGNPQNGTYPGSVAVSPSPAMSTCSAPAFASPTA